MASSGKSKHQKKIEKLEREKLELEIAQLKNSPVKNNRRLFLIQSFTPLVVVIVAFLSVYLGFFKDRSQNMVEGKEARIEAAYQSNQTALADIDLKRRKNTLMLQISGFENEKAQIFAQTNRLLTQSDSAQFVIKQQNQEVGLLAGNISGLKRSKILLETELDFGSINVNFQLFKKSEPPSIKDICFNSIRSQILLNPQYKNRILDSLETLWNKTDFTSGYIPMTNFLSYLISNDNKYKDRILSDLEKSLESRSSEIFSGTLAEVLTSQLWSLKDRHHMCSLYIKYFNKQTFLGKSILSSIIGTMAQDQKFKLASIDYDFYWASLKFNRDCLFSNNRYVHYRITLNNIWTLCPPLFIAIIGNQTNLKEVDVNNFNKIRVKLIPYLTSNAKDYLPALVPNETRWFKNIQDELGLETLSENDGIKIYSKYKESVDFWVCGNFEKFRNDKAHFDEYMSQKKF